MTKCSYYGENLRDLPFKCFHCGKLFCVNHRLSDNHECSQGLEIEKIRDSMQKEALEREEISNKKCVADELNWELKLLVEMGLINLRRNKKMELY